jgi:hypothetical protein
MENRVQRLAQLGATLLALFLICACSSGGGDGSSASLENQSIADLALGVSSAYCGTDNSGAITIFASVVDDRNVAVPEAIITFKATGGVLSDLTALTDENGTAEVTFSSGYLDKSNRQVVVTAEVNSLSAQVPISITGTTATATAVRTSLVIGGEDTDTLTIDVTDAGGNPIYDTVVTLSVADGSTGSVSFSATSGRTDANGQFQTNVTATSPGTVTVLASAAGATATEEYTAAATTSALFISSPSADPSSMSTDQTLTIIVRDPTPGPSNQVVLATTVGTLFSGGQSGTALTLPVSNGQVQAFLTASEAGVATITAYDKDFPSTTDTLAVVIYAPVEDADQIALQSGSSVVALSTGGTSNSVEIVAKVVNATDEGVGGAPVVFALEDTTGGGEFISPSIVYTDASGTATTNFFSGTKSSGGEGVTVKAYLLSNPNIDDTIPIVIGGTAGSVVIGLSSKIASSYGDTAYDYSVSVIVADTHGNPIENANVSLSLWPTHFAYWEVTERYYPDTGALEFEYDAYWLPNEDIDENTYLDPGENNQWPYDNQLTPGNSAAGSIPPTVTTDEFGVATVTWTYLKEYARWLKVDISATTYVLGTETTSTLNVVPPILDGDEDDLKPYPPWSIVDRIEVSSRPDLYFISDQTVIAGMPLTFQVVAFDSDDGDVLTYTLDSRSIALGMWIDPVTGRFTWTPGTDDIGDHSVTVTVTDDSEQAFTDTETFTITVQ